MEVGVEERNPTTVCNYHVGLRKLRLEMRSAFHHKHLKFYPFILISQKENATPPTFISGAFFYVSVSLVS